MAYITKTPSGKYRVSVVVNYKRFTKTCRTKAECNAWAVEIKSNNGTSGANKTFGELLDNYKNKVSVHKKGERWESVRIEKLKRDPIANIKINSLTKADFADWRDRRMLEVSNLSVLREWTLLSHAIDISISEWEWMKVNPMKGLKKPIGEPPRDRTFSDKEIEALCFALNYFPDEKPEQVIARVGASMMFAIETALRAQELCNLRWLDVNGSVIKINASKTRAGVREVPLSPKAVAILKQMKGVDDDLVFNLKTSQIDSLFRKAKKQTGIEDLHFHDSRATAITRLAQKLNILELAYIVGHKDIRMLQIYYRPTTESIAKKL